MSFKGIVKGLIVSVLLTAISLFVLSLISYFTNAEQKYLNIAMYFMSAVSVFVGAILCTRVSGEKILLNGLTYSLTFILVLVAVSIFKNGSVATNMRFFSVCAGVILSSFVGVIVTNKNFL